jgi:hypothetical protein
MTATQSISPLHGDGASKGAPYGAKRIATQSIASLHRDGAPYRAEPSSAQSHSQLRPKPIRQDGAVQEGPAPDGAERVAAPCGAAQIAVP